jgi:nucleolar protein 14
MAAAVAPSGDEAKRLLQQAEREQQRSLQSTIVSILSLLPTDLPHPSSPELVSPLLSLSAAILASLPTSSPPASRPLLLQLKKLIASAMERWLIKRDAVAITRTSLRLRTRVAPPPALKELVPLVEDPRSRFSEHLSKRGPEAEELEMKEEIRRLKKEKKREERGAVRELRKDREFVVRELDASMALREGQREAALKSLMKDLNQQQTEFKQTLKKGKRIEKEKDPTENYATLINVGKTKKDRRARKLGSNK